MLLIEQDGFNMACELYSIKEKLRRIRNLAWDNAEINITEEQKIIHAKEIIKIVDEIVGVW